MEDLIQKEILSSSISVSSGGLAIVLAKASLGGMLGCNIDISNLNKEIKTLEAKLFSESQGRILVSIPSNKVKTFEKMARNIPHTKLGQVSKNNKFIITDNKRKIIEINVQSLYSAYHKFSNKMQ